MPLLAVLLAAQFMANVDNAIVNVAAPPVRATLGASGGELELVVSGYVLAFAMLLITGARLGDLYGYRPVFVIGVAGFTVTSLACALAPTSVVGRQRVRTRPGSMRRRYRPGRHTSSAIASAAAAAASVTANAAPCP